MPDIKTRVVAEKAVKTIDKSAIAAQRMKNAYVQAKEKAERSVPVDQESPENYAADRVSDEANTTVFEGVHQLDRQGRKGLEITKANIAKAKARFQRKRLTDRLKKKAGKGAAKPASPPVEVEDSTRQNPGTQRAANPVRRPAGAGPSTYGKQTPMKAVGRTGKSVKQIAKSTGQTTAKTAKRTIKTAERTSKATVKTAEHTAKAAQKTAQATARAAKATVQSAHATAKAAAAAAKASAKTVAAAVKAIISSVKILVSAIAAGGWVAMVVLVVICLIGLIVSSPFGIFFSGEESGTGQTMPTAVREINRDYEGKLEEIKSGNVHDVMEMSGSRAVWPEVLAIYAVKTSTDPDNPLEVATMDDSKKELLKEIFWAMNEVGQDNISTVDSVKHIFSVGKEQIEKIETIKGLREDSRHQKELVKKLKGELAEREGAFDKAKIRLLNNRSHLRVIQDSQFADDIDSITILPNTLKYLLEFMRKHDERHYNTLAILCDPQYDEDGDAVEVEQVVEYTVKLYEMPASAGPGNFLEDSIDAQEITVTNPDCSFAVKISGDSMEPKIIDGSIALVKRCEDVPNAHIGIVWYQGKSYCKKIVQKEDGLLLVSINKAYTTIEVTSYEDWRVFGEVIEIIPPN